jgi:anti-sigma factor RsiW
MSGGNDSYHTNWDEQRERLSAYLDGELPTSERAPLERHLAGCAECRRELDELREVRALLRALPVPAAPRSFTIPAGGAVPEPIAPRQAARAGRAGGLIARAAQWTGGVAAAAGLLLVLGSALSGLGGFHAGGAESTSSAGAPAAAPNSPVHTPLGTRGPQVGATSGTGTQSAATLTPTPSATPSATAASAETKHIYGAPEISVPPLPLTGAGLIAGGAVLLVAGKAAERRRRRTARASRAG